MWIIRHAFAIAVPPFTVAVLVPLFLCRRYSVTFRPPLNGADWACVIVAAAFFLIGVVLFVSSVALFATRGRGTLAPWDPPARLVAVGPYRYVRNPMISGVLAVVAAEALLLRSPIHFVWLALFLVVNLIYIPLFEEPQLQLRFGEQYTEYKRNVPGLLPRWRPWISTG